MDRPVSRANRHEIATTIDLAANFVPPQLSVGGYGNIEVDVSVAGMQVHVGSHGAGNFQRYAAITGLEPPACIQRRPSRRAYFDGTVARLDFELVKTSIGPNVPVTCAGPQLAVDGVKGLRAVAAAKIHFTLEAGNFDLAIPGVQIDTPFTRHVDID